MKARSTARRLFNGLALMAALFGLHAPPALADVYTFTDPQGVLHFSSDKTDSRFSLFESNGNKPTHLTQWFYRQPDKAAQPAAREQNTKTARRSNSLVPSALRVSYGKEIARVANLHGIDQALLAAVVKVESGFNPHARSAAGARGLMQLMPGTARRFGAVNVNNPMQNLAAGAKYLRYLLDEFNGNKRLAIAAYNAGEGTVHRFGRIPPYRETRNYVARVMANYHRFMTASE